MEWQTFLECPKCETKINYNLNSFVLDYKVVILFSDERRNHCPGCSYPMIKQIIRDEKAQTNWVDFYDGWKKVTARWIPGDRVAIGPWWTFGFFTKQYPGYWETDEMYWEQLEYQRYQASKVYKDINFS